MSYSSLFRRKKRKEIKKGERNPTQVTNTWASPFSFFRDHRRRRGEGRRGEGGRERKGNSFHHPVPRHQGEGKKERRTTSEHAYPRVLGERRGGKKGRKKKGGKGP